MTAAVAEPTSADAVYTATVMAAAVFDIGFDLERDGDDPAVEALAAARAALNLDAEDCLPSGQRVRVSTYFVRPIVQTSDPLAS